MNSNFKHNETESSPEPADPPNPDHEKRRKTRLAPDSCIDEVPKPLIECGCGHCPSGADPLADNDNGQSAAEICECPRAVTVGKAKKIYIVYDRKKWKQSDKTSKYEEEKKNYAKILEADRDLIEEFEGLTTVLFTIRIRPRNSNKEWINPFDLLYFLFCLNSQSRIRKSIRYQLKKVKDIEYRYVSVVAPTESAATPHVHWYIWAHDPDDEITTEDFAPALDKHLQSCSLAYEEDHGYADDGSDGAISIRHDPPMTDQSPEKESDIDTPNGRYEEVDGYQTQGAQYLASQLTYLPLGDFFDSAKSDPEETLLEGAAIKWMSSYNWFNSSQGL